MNGLCTQNSMLLTNLLKFNNKYDNMERILPIINGESIVSLRLIDWFATNYSKKNLTKKRRKILDFMKCCYLYAIVLIKINSNWFNNFKLYIKYHRYPRSCRFWLRGKSIFISMRRISFNRR